MVLAEGNCSALNDETGADLASARFREVVKTIGPDSKARVEEDLKIENEFFGLVKGQIPKRKSADPAFLSLKS